MRDSTLFRKTRSRITLSIVHKFTSITLKNILVSWWRIYKRVDTIQQALPRRTLHKCPDVNKFQPGKERTMHLTLLEAHAAVVRRAESSFDPCRSAITTLLLYIKVDMLVPTTLRENSRSVWMFLLRQRIAFVKCILRL